MSNMTVNEAYAQYGAKLVNRQWAMSSIAENGDLVVSCWSHYFKTPEKGTLRYSDTFSRWKANEAGSTLLKEHLAGALKDNTPVRIVFATTVETDLVDAGLDVAAASKKYHVRRDIKGRLVSFDGDSFVLDFKKEDDWANMPAAKHGKVKAG
ncbi:MAG: hypothetical protein IPK65_07905 [Gammaproteobacteria bacterium]|nr:hypothetical protein [Gammaproteobacteria bacterium]